MEYSVEKIGNNRVMVNVPGDLETSAEAEELKGALDQLLDEGEKEIVLNLDKTTSLTSHGIGKLLMFHKRLKDIGGQLYITPPKGDVENILKTLKLDEVLNIYTG